MSRGVCVCVYVCENTFSILFLWAIHVCNFWFKKRDEKKEEDKENNDDDNNHDGNDNFDVDDEKEESKKITTNSWNFHIFFVFHPRKFYFFHSQKRLQKRKATTNDNKQFWTIFSASSFNALRNICFQKQKTHFEFLLCDDISWNEKTVKTTNWKTIQCDLLEFSFVLKLEAQSG